MANIKYKVVRRGSRRSAFMRNDYALIYERGQIVKAPKHSLGIFVFVRRCDAEVFADANATGYDWRNDFLILRVEPLSKGKSMDSILNDAWVNSIRMKRGWRDYVWNAARAICGVGSRWMRAPDGSMCYPAVKVLD